MIDAHTPDELGLPAPLWTCRAVQELIRRCCARHLPIRTVGDYLRRWGYTPKRPSRRSRRQDPAEVQTWLRQTYPAIAARADPEGAEIHWCGKPGSGQRAPRARVRLGGADPGYGGIGEALPGQHRDLCHHCLLMYRG